MPKTIRTEHSSIEDRPVERVPAYRDSSGKVIRVAVLGIAALAVGGIVAYSQMQPNPPAAASHDQVAANTPLHYTPAAPMMAAPPVPPTPMPQATPKAGAPVKATPAHPKPRPSDGPTPAPLSSGTGQSIDVDPQTPQVLTPIPDQVAPATP